MSGLVAPQAVGPQPLVGGRLVAERVEVMAAQAHVDLHVTPPSPVTDGEYITSASAG